MHAWPSQPCARMRGPPSCQGGLGHCHQHCAGSPNASTHGSSPPAPTRLEVGVGKVLGPALAVSLQRPRSHLALSASWQARQGLPDQRAHGSCNGGRRGCPPPPKPPPGMQPCMVRWRRGTPTTTNSGAGQPNYAAIHPLGAVCPHTTVSHHPSPIPSSSQDKKEHVCPPPYLRGQVDDVLRWVLVGEEVGHLGAAVAEVVHGVGAWGKKERKKEKKERMNEGG